MDGRIALRALGLAAGLTGTDGARAGARSSAMGCGWEGFGGGCGGCGCGCGWGVDGVYISKAQVLDVAK